MKFTYSGDSKPDIYEKSSACVPIDELNITIGKYWKNSSTHTTKLNYKKKTKKKTWKERNETNQWKHVHTSVKWKLLKPESCVIID